MHARVTAAAAMVALGLLLIGCDRSGDVDDPAPEAAAPPPEAGAPRPPPQQPTAPDAGEVAEVSYRISGAVDETHDEVGEVICSSTPDDQLLAQNFGGEWSLRLSVSGAGPGEHDAELTVGPPNRDGLWEGRQIDDPRGTGRNGRAVIADTGERDGHGYRIVTIEFNLPEVELLRSSQIVGVEGRFRCGVIEQG